MRKIIANDALKQNSSMTTQIRSVHPGGATPYHIAWLSLIAASQAFSVRTAEEVISGTMNPANFLRLTLVTVAIAMLGSQISKRFTIKLDAITLFLLYAFFCIISSAWSISFIPTLGKSVEFFVGVLVIFVALNVKPSPMMGNILSIILNTTLLLVIIILSVMLFGYFVAPSLFSIPMNGIFSRRLGIENLFISANSVAYFGAIVGSYSFAKILFKNKKLINLLIYILSWSVIILAQGRTGAAALLISSLLFTARKFKSISFPILLILITIAYACYGLLESFLVRGESKELLFTLTGRTVLWEKAWYAFLDRPWFGYGFGVGSRYVFLHDISGFDVFISSIHNSYVEVILSVGIIGFIFFSFALISSIRLIFQSYIEGKNLEITASVMPILIVTPMTSGLTVSWGIMSGIFLAGIAILANHQRITSLKRKTYPTSLNRI